MEPFFLRCETCQARLRVRDERFLGQIQSCPKCGSMVHILAPAGRLAANEATPETVPELTEVAAAATPSAIANSLAWLRNHAIASSVTAAGLVLTCSLVAFLALRGEQQVATLPPATTTIESPTPELPSGPSAEVDSPETPIVDSNFADEVAEAVVPVEPQPEEETVEVAGATESSFLPLITPKPIDVSAAKSVESRTLTLEPVKAKPQPTSSTATAVSAPDYPPAVEIQAAEVEAETGPVAAVKVPAAESDLPSLDPPVRTNVMDQLSMPIDSIDLPKTTLGEFVGFMSIMAAVPIELDAKVLGEVGLSTRSTVAVQGDDTTVGKLLARVLKEHHLTCVTRDDGTLVVVRAKR